MWVQRPAWAVPQAPKQLAGVRRPFEDVLGEDLVDQLPIDALVLDRHLAADQHADDRLAAAPAGAARLAQDDVLPPGGGNVLAELVHHRARAGSVLAGRRADLDHNPAAPGPPAECFFGLRRKGLKSLENNVVCHRHPWRWSRVVGWDEAECAPACGLMVALRPTLPNCRTTH
jgi:hypothetical protein